MTALLGVIGEAAPAGGLKRALQRLRISDSLRAQIVLERPGRHVAAIEPANQAGAGCFQEAGLTLCAAGCFERRGGRIDFAALLRTFADQGLAALQAADGSHMLALFDDARHSLLLQPDPVGTTPLFYASHQGCFAFGPDAFSVLLLLGLPARIDRRAATQFLLNRYLAGNDCLCAGVHRLGPGERLQLDLRSMQLVRSRFWDLHFSHELKSPVEAREALHQGLLEAHQQMLSGLSSDEGYHCFLTGGMDSRGILGYARELGRLPQRAITWGRCDNIAESDPTIARQMAGVLGIPFTFQAVSAEDWPLHAARWADISGLLSDNSNSFASPLETFHAHGSDTAAFVVLGDEAFGAGPIPASRRQAIDNIQRTALHTDPGLLGQVLAPEALHAALADFQAGLNAIAERCPGEHLKDVQDYLYFHTYIARWILAPGNFKWPVYSARRPMMALSVLEQVGRFSPLLRVDKRVYVELLEQRFPDIAAIPRTARDSGIDWGQAMCQPGLFRDTMLNLLSDEALDRLPILDSLNRDGIRGLVLEATRLQPVASGTEPALEGPLKRGLYSMRRKLSRSPALARMASRIQPWVLQATGQRGAETRQRRHQILMRLALLQYAVDATETLNQQIAQASVETAVARSESRG